MTLRLVFVVSQIYRESEIAERAFVVPTLATKGVARMGHLAFKDFGTLGLVRIICINSASAGPLNSYVSSRN
jgi:hypothetical protein